MANALPFDGMFLALVPVKFRLNLCGMPIWGDVNHPEAGATLINVLAVG
jgi:hypothetical protein